MKNQIVKLSAVMAAAVSGSALADDVGTAIGTAVTTGQTNYGLVVVGLIGLGALGFGLRQIMKGMGS